MVPAKFSFALDHQIILRVTTPRLLLGHTTHGHSLPLLGHYLRSFIHLISLSLYLLSSFSIATLPHQLQNLTLLCLIALTEFLPF